MPAHHHSPLTLLPPRSLSLVAAMTVALTLPSVAPAEPATLWTTDDATQTAYQVDLDGSLLGSFETLVSIGGGQPFLDSPSGIAVDHSRDSLWVVFENPPRLANYAKSGNQIGDVISLAGIAEGPEGVAVALDAEGSTLWVVDDPVPGSTQVPTIRRFTTEGDLLPGAIPTSAFDVGATSPQGITVDPDDGSLWLTDNASDLIYHIDLSGLLLDSFHSPFAPGNVDCQGASISRYNTNPQGITVDRRDGSLWITDRTAQRIYNVDRAGVVLGSFCPNDVDAAALNPSGVAFDPGLFADLGAAEGFAALSLEGAAFHLESESLVDGDAGVGPRGEQRFQRSTITGGLVLDPTVARREAKEMLVGEQVVADLRPALTDVLSVAKAATLLPATARAGEIKESTLIEGGPGLNVIDTRKIELKDETLTLRGDAGSEFIIRVAEKVKLEEASRIRLEGGLKPERVLILTLGGDIEVKSRSAATGVYVSVEGKAKVEDGSQVVGAVIAGEEVVIKERARVIAELPRADVIDLGAAEGFTALSLDRAVFKLDEGARIDGDAGVGPHGEQDFERSQITGRLVLDPDVAKLHAKDMSIGSQVVANLRPAVIAARRMAAIAGALPATRSLGAIQQSSRIEGAPGLNVIDVEKIELKGETLTLRGDADSEFVIRLAGRLKLEEASEIVLEGLEPQQVLFHVPADDVEIKSGSRAAGIYLSIDGKTKVEQASLVQGSVLSGDQVEIKRGGEVGP